jgi:hypothetical protein
MFEQLSPEAELLHPVTPAQLTGRAGCEKRLVIVEVGAPPLLLVLPVRLLLVDVGHALLAEGTVVEPVVPGPSVHHGIHRHRDLQSRMGIDQGHQRQETVVGDAEDPDLPVALRDVLHQPVDGVPGIGRVVDRRRIQRAAQRAIHHVIALRVVLAAHVLDDADVAAFDDDVGGVVVSVQVGSEM